MLLMQLGSLEDKLKQWNNSFLENSVIIDQYRNNQEYPKSGNSWILGWSSKNEILITVYYFWVGIYSVWLMAMET